MRRGMSNDLLHEPLALAARSLDLHESEQSCLFHFDVSAQEWLSRVDPHADVEEFVTAFGAYLEQEKERVMRLPRTLLASDLRFLSEDRGAILSMTQARLCSSTKVGFSGRLLTHEEISHALSRKAVLVRKTRWRL
jgi:hypothetical protein